MTESSTLGEYAAVYGFARTAAKLVRLPCGDADCHVASLLAMTCKNLLRVRTPRTHYRGKFPPVCAFTQQRPFAHAEAPPSFAFHRANPPLQPLTRFFLQHGIARRVLTPAHTSFLLHGIASQCKMGTGAHLCGPEKAMQRSDLRPGFSAGKAGAKDA